MGKHTPDFESYYGNKRLSDVRLVLVEEGCSSSSSSSSSSRGKRRRQQEYELACHGLVLVAFSGYCRTKLENWDTAGGSSSSSKGSSSQLHRIEMSVPAGQLEVGQLLIKGMYQRQPDLSSLSQLQLLQLLLLLADRYEVPKVLDAVCEAFEAMPADQIQWDTVTAVYQLPSGCAELQACKGVFDAAAAKMQQELGDLELVWAHAGNKQHLLCGLPFAALKQLLQDERTRVSSENTVFYTIQQWYEKQQRAPQQQQVDELMRLIRIRHCSQLYVSTVMLQSELFTRCFSHAELGLACILAGAGPAPASQAAAEHYYALRVPCCLTLTKYPSWQADKRPRSAMQRLVIDWRPHLEDLQGEYKEDGHLLRMHATGEKVAWRGRCMQPYMSTCSLCRVDAAGELHVYLDFALKPDSDSMLDSEVRVVKGNITCLTAAAAAAASRGHPPSATASSTNDCSAGSQSLLSEGLYLGDFTASSFNIFPEIEAALRSKQLVHPDGTLHIRYELTNLA